MEIYKETLIVILGIDSAARKLSPLVFVGKTYGARGR